MHLEKLQVRTITSYNARLDSAYLVEQLCVENQKEDNKVVIDAITWAIGDMENLGILDSSKVK